MRHGLVILVATALSNCGRAPENGGTAFSPKPGDDRWTKGTVILASPSLSSAGILSLAGMLPTPCHELRVSAARDPDAAGFVSLEAWSVSDPEQICAQVLQPFSVQLPMRPGSRIKVNGQTVGK
jgi:hypothetical protein